MGRFAAMAAGVRQAWRCFVHAVRDFENREVSMANEDDVFDVIVIGAGQVGEIAPQLQCGVPRSFRTVRPIGWTSGKVK